jgi:hypothetical protein
MAAIPAKESAWISLRLARRSLLLSWSLATVTDHLIRSKINAVKGFVGEIKAVFGVEKCFFLVAVAEDVGSIFAQRATAGRSILEIAL